MGSLFSSSVHSWPAAVLGANGQPGSANSSSTCRGSLLGAFTVCVDIVSETLGVGGAVIPEWGVDSALVDSTSSSFFFLFFSSSLFLRGVCRNTTG